MRKVFRILESTWSCTRRDAGKLNDRFGRSAERNSWPVRVIFHDRCRSGRASPAALVFVLRRVRPTVAKDKEMFQVG